MNSLIHWHYSHLFQCLLIVKDSSIWLWCEVESARTRHQSLRQRAQWALLFGSVLNTTTHSPSRLPAGMFVRFSNKVHTFTADNLSAACILNLLVESATASHADCEYRSWWKTGSLLSSWGLNPRVAPTAPFQSGVLLHISQISTLEQQRP